MPDRPTTGRVKVYQSGLLVAQSANLVVSSGNARKASWFASNTPNGGTAIKPPGYIAVGGGNAAPTAADVALGFEYARIPLTTATHPSPYLAHLSATFGATSAAFNNAYSAGYIEEYGLFDSPGDTGTTSGGNTGTTLNDTTKTWIVNQWAGMTVFLTANLANYDIRTIVSNTATQLTISAPWSVIPPNTNSYAIGGVAPGQFMFARAVLASFHNPVGPPLSLTATWEITTPGV